MPLPKRIQAQLEQADALLAQQSGGAPPVEVQQPQEPQEEVVPVVNEPQASTPPVAPVDTVVEPTTPTTPVDPWEHRFKTLQGIHNAQMRDFRERESELTSRLTALAEKVATGRPAETQPEANPTIGKHEENFGADMVGMVRDVVSTMFMPQVQEVLNRLADLETQFKGTTQAVEQTALEVFQDKLAKLVPDWQTVNTDMGFLEWLAQKDPFSGVIRQQVLTDAGNKLDADRVAAVFNAYKALIQPPAQTPTPQAPKPPSLESQVSPRASAPAPVQPNPQPTFVSEKDVLNFYADVRAGKYRGNPAEQNRLEAYFNQALAEGRIR